MKELIENWKKRAEVFMDKDIAIHLTLKNNTWLNGYITKIFDDYFIILDREDGEVPVFFIDIQVFELYKGDESRLKKPIGALK